MPNPSDRKYSKEHAWCKVEAGVATVGITDYAQRALTDIVFAELPKQGAVVEKGRPMCTVESVKSVSEVSAPVSGEVVEVNKQLGQKPELLNKDPFGEGWIAKIKMSEEKELAGLMAAAEYEEYIKGL